MKLTTITKIIIYLMALAVIIICGGLFPELAREEAVSNPNASSATPFLIAAWVIAAPIFVALYQALKIIKFIEENNAFSDYSIKALKLIKTCAIIFSLLIIAGAIAVITIAKTADPSEDVTFVITFGFIFIFISITIATFVAVAQRLVQNVIDMKSENELTI